MISLVFTLWTCHIDTIASLIFGFTSAPQKTTQQSSMISKVAPTKQHSKPEELSSFPKRIFPTTKENLSIGPDGDNPCQYHPYLPISTTMV
jgi:hypothetical protein